VDFNSHEDIEIRYCTDGWGPFLFNFSGALPSSSVINSVVVKAYLDRVVPGDSLLEEIDITSDVIDSDYIPQISDNTKVSVKFEIGTRINIRATLIFEIVTASGAKHPFYFHYVKIGNG
jgi:hypothetical protein